MPICSNQRAIPDDLSLRVATPADEVAVSAILRSSYGRLYRGWYRDEALTKALPAMARANPALLASGRYFLVEDAAGPIACGGWSAERPGGGATPGVGHVRHFATHPDHLGRGAASAILERCMREAAAHGLVELECQSSLAAEAFYASHGFNSLGAVNVSIGGAPFACMLMKRSLDDVGPC